MSEKEYDKLNKRFLNLANSIDELNYRLGCRDYLRYPQDNLQGYLVPGIHLKDAVEAIITHLNIDLETTDAIPSKVVAKRRHSVKKT